MRWSIKYTLKFKSQMRWSIKYTLKFITDNGFVNVPIQALNALVKG